MSKIPIKRMNDVIAELQNESSSCRVPSSINKHSICSRLAANLIVNSLSNNNKRVKRSHDLPMSTESSGSNVKDNNQASLAAAAATTTTTTTTASPPDESSLTPSHLSHVAAAIAELREVYLYGLCQVSDLQDLQHAPDAILPGNIVYEDEYETTALQSS
jgi:hypothetical protein